MARLFPAWPCQPPLDLRGLQDAEGLACRPGKYRIARPLPVGAALVAALNVGAGQRGNAVNGFLELIERILPVGIRSIRFYNPLTVLSGAASAGAKRPGR